MAQGSSPVGSSLWIGKSGRTANQSPPGEVAASTGPDPGSKTLQEELPFPRKQDRAEENFLHLGSLWFGGWRCLPLGWALYKSLEFAGFEEKAPGRECSCFHTPSFPDSKEREGDRKQGSEHAPLCSITTTPLPEPTWVSLSDPWLVHSLWHCAPVSIPTHICTHTSPHTYTQMPNFLSESTQEAEWCPTCTIILCSKGSPWPTVSQNPAPGLAPAGIPRLLRRGWIEQGAHQRHVIQSVEYVHIRLWYSTNLMFL